MRTFFITLSIASLLVLSGVAFAQQDPNTGTYVNTEANPFTGGQVNDQNNPNTDANVNQNQNPNENANVNEETNVNENTNANDQINANSQDQNLAEQNYVNDQQNVNTAQNLTDPNANYGYFLNDQYNVSYDNFNPFIGLGHNQYDPWQQGLFNNSTFQSWSGDYNDPNGTDYTATLNDTFDKTKASQLKQFKFGTSDLFSNGVHLSSSPGTCSRTLKTFSDIIYYIVCIINTFIIQLLITLAFIYFAWGVSQYVVATGNAEERKKARNIIIYGLIALFVIVCVWGLVRLFKLALGL